MKNHLVAVRSFLGFWKIPLDVDLPKHACVIWHNRDLKKEEIKQILTFASARDRVIWLVMAESGMRADTAVNLKYWQIREDFEAKRVPMKSLLPSSVLKDHVGDRWTFLGEDGFRELSDYLQRRMPLEKDDFVFASEREGKVKGEQFSPASISTKFNRIVQKLGIDKSVSIDPTTGKLRKGERPKPKQIRLHGLRKFFRNNMRAEKGYLDFWMGHSLGVDAHYISRDPEEHRQRYLQGYKYLRLYEASPETLSDVYEQMRLKDREIKDLKGRLDSLQPFITSVENLKKDQDALRLFVGSWLNDNLLKDPEEGQLGAEISEELSKRLAEALKKAIVDLGLKEFSKKKQKSI
jgi:integrase